MIQEDLQRVYIVGPRKAQNHLLAGYLASATGIPSEVFPAVEAVPRNGASPHTLLLKDCPHNERELLLDVLPKKLGHLGQGHIFALFNVMPDLAVEREAFALGVKGFFYKTDEPDTLVRGVRALFDGELWMSRRAMTECLLAGVTVTPRTPDPEHDLTPREIEVLQLIALGRSNEDIAEKLFISLNTAKTHVYRIFRKIKVENRLQAALWAAQNL